MRADHFGRRITGIRNRYRYRQSRLRTALQSPLAHGLVEYRAIPDRAHTLGTDAGIESGLKEALAYSHDIKACSVLADKANIAHASISTTGSDNSNLTQPSPAAFIDDSYRIPGARLPAPIYELGEM